MANSASTVKTCKP